ncbi:hypothetical protein GCM10023085_41870 [Actinomadura viridis]|uniref:DUF7691 domain-containing protein n=1 Tax=Actinomadura viridis TaxID=58110 RepID=A0A931DRL1_9ACTN|nr:hypothetical protein [Actinomadura viridis]MBG6092536.1 hypothetical protein [Actinomadura viridis]
MSYAIMPYAVHPKGIRSMIGSRDERLLAYVKSRWAAELREYDELLDFADGDHLFPARVALRRMVMGEEYDERIGFIYAYCLEILVAAHEDTDRLPNDGWREMGGEWLRTVGNELRRAGADFEPAVLVLRGEPVPLPPLGDLSDPPNVGHLRNAEMPAVLASFDGLDAARVTEPGVLEAVRQIEEWLRTCVKTGRDLVCFHY